MTAGGKGRTVLAVVLGLLALGTAALALYLCVRTPEETILLSEPESPALTVSAFFDALCRGDATAAALSVRGDPDLGLADEPEDGETRQLWDAFRRSFAWESAGECVRTGTAARQTVRFTCLSLAALTDGLDTEIQAELARRVDAAERKEDIYNADNTFRDDVTLAVFSAALSGRLADPAPYLTTTELEIRLRYEDLRWVIEPDEALWTALAGGGS